MGSLRNPVGPLPSSIYWRRRAVLLSLLAVLALLVTWLVTVGGGGGKNAGGADGKGPAPSITPGPSGSGPAISEQPGGRDESDGGNGSGGSGSSGGSGDSKGSGGEEAGGGSDGGSGGGSGGGAGSGTGGGSGGAVYGGGSGDRVPAGSSLPDCTTGSVKLTVHSVRNSYQPGRKPQFEITVSNSSGSACKIDLGPVRTVLTITPTGDDQSLWASDDCVRGGGSRLLRVPADGRVKQTVTWDRRPGAAECATPSGGPAPTGTYLVEAKAPGFPKVRTSFVLAAD
ncbi:hypothetical protein [Streptomyces sp. NPDC058045]|uniref:hypothetical protein n=1 Tax=Streptomyces sp. NPDC058045 TaxID=3346311 RepID=UPI0036EE5024